MASKKYDVVAAVGETKDGKAVWRNIGAVIQTDKGFRLKLESVPVGWDGWAGLFEPKPKQERQPEPQGDPGFDPDVGF